MKRFMEFLRNIDGDELCLLIMATIVIAVLEIMCNLVAWNLNVICGLITTFVLVVIPVTLIWLWLKARE